MSIFAPVYRPTATQQSYIDLQQKQDRKRKRAPETVDSGQQTPRQQSPDLDETTPRTGPTAFRPINNRDPYFVAGHARELPLPPPPFPHAPIKDFEPVAGRLSLEAELAGLNPPVYVHRREPDLSLKRQHVGNLTTIVHRCMLSGDWKRASRAWGLLLRTEIGGRGVDVRQNGRWGIGAELLMRRDAPSSRSRRGRSLDSQVEDEEDSEVESIDEAPFTDAGFEQARDYCERLILQYPHTPRAQHNLNATLFYPALFNVWVFEVQNKSRRARAKLAADAARSSSSSGSDADSVKSADGDVLLDIRRRELEEALPILRRIDELVLSPPYDTSLPLMRLRGMMGLWLFDLQHPEQRSRPPSSIDDEAGGSNRRVKSEPGWDSKMITGERKKALRLLQKVKIGGGNLPVGILDLLEGENDEMSEVEISETS